MRNTQHAERRIAAGIALAVAAVCSHATSTPPNAEAAMRAQSLRKRSRCGSKPSFGLLHGAPLGT